MSKKNVKTNSKKSKRTEDDNTPSIGHNSGVSGARLKPFIERIERLEEEKKGIAEDIRDVYVEVKSTGFDTKTVRKTIRLRKMDAEKRREEQELLDLYCAAIGLA